MPVPKQRHTKSRRNKRRSHHALKIVALTPCPKCKIPIMPHRVCYNCGVYRGRTVIDVLLKLSKREKKKKQKELAVQEKEQEKIGGGAAAPKGPLSPEELSKK